MSIQKKSLINNLTATKKAIIASNATVPPVLSNKTAMKVSASKLAAKTAMKVSASKLAAKTAMKVSASKLAAKTAMKSGKL